MREREPVYSSVMVVFYEEGVAKGFLRPLVYAHISNKYAVVIPADAGIQGVVVKIVVWNYNSGYPITTEYKTKLQQPRPEGQWLSGFRQPPE